MLTFLTLSELTPRVSKEPTPMRSKSLSKESTPVPEGTRKTASPTIPPAENSSENKVAAPSSGNKPSGMSDEATVPPDDKTGNSASAKDKQKSEKADEERGGNLENLGKPLPPAADLHIDIRSAS